ncbi:MAG: aromatic amino acid lyase [Bacillota bacterium]
MVSGGNFHGQPLAVAADYLGLSLCSLGQHLGKACVQVV